MNSEEDDFNVLARADTFEKECFQSSGEKKLLLLGITFEVFRNHFFWLEVQK